MVGVGLKLEINIPSQRIRAKWKGGLINEGGVISSEYGIHATYCSKQVPIPHSQFVWFVTIVPASEHKHRERGESNFSHSVGTHPPSRFGTQTH